MIKKEINELTDDEKTCCIQCNDAFQVSTWTDNDDDRILVIETTAPLAICMAWINWMEKKDE